IVLNPARSGIMLREFLLADGDDLHVRAENDSPAGRRALVDRENMPAHVPSRPYLSSSVTSVSRNTETKLRLFLKQNECQTKPISAATRDRAPAVPPRNRGRWPV